ncbi:sirohydrochlorin nickelochelatase [Methanolapillus ohkumae]|uniref:Sirohydrochlorin cobaltochelatase n=1 Tax=Methanolapillus ohkumae TaxID=3028298 RepID=A0AA97A645_9EURY|nr:hypothetical protein MsAm2_07760 [Methanosarcinaceae archaeon Am2]
MSKKETLLLVGHGSKLPYSKQLLMDVAEKVKNSGRFENVEIGLMEFNEPTIPQSLKKIIAGGSKKITVVPVFLAPGTHTEKDIPRILGLLKDNQDHHQHCHDNGIDHEHHDDDHNDDHDDDHDDDHKNNHDGKKCGHGQGHGHGHGHHGHHHDFENVEIPRDVEIIYKKPIGADDRIAEIIMERALGI